ncbi:MAG: hypothetical protein ACKOOG_09190 [Actinomycetota bacterium]
MADPLPTTLAELPRDRLLTVVYEHMLFGMLANRATLPQVVVAGGGPDDVDAIAIDLWMGASPVYTQRTRTLMGIDGDDVPAIMKALQLDVGFVHQYMDVHYRVRDPLHGEFWLAHCGALLDTEPFGPDRVVGMCHTIEDPTFDATAYSTNPRARIRPIHRPPRRPADRAPHCHWTIEIDPANDPVGPARLTERIAALPLAALPVAALPTADGYGGPFDPDRHLDGFSSRALLAFAPELAMQTHLLMSSAEIAVAERFGAERARELIADAWGAAAWITTERLVAALGESASVATVLALHPAIPPGFARAIERDDRSFRCVLEPAAPALLDPAQPGWIGALVRGDRRGFDGIIAPAALGARVDAITVSDGRVVIEGSVDPDRGPLPEPEAMAFMRIGLLSSWSFSLPG